MRMSTVLLALTLLAAVLRTGAQYFYCPIMNVVVSTHCCASSRNELTRANDVPPAVQLPDCCERRRAAALPVTDSSINTTAVSPAPLTRTLDAFPSPRPHSTLGTRALGANQRAGPLVATSCVGRAVRLQVFLI